MNDRIASFLARHVAPNMPGRRLCSYIYKKTGLENSENIRNHTYIESVKALKIGKNSFINRGCYFYNGYEATNSESHITIGSNVTIGYGVTIITTTHTIGGGYLQSGFPQNRLQTRRNW